MEKYLFIAEKPSLMRSVKEVYDKNPEIKEKVGEIIFRALHGHVCGYAQPKDYKKWAIPWSKIPIPIFPEPWEINVTDKKSFHDIVNAYRGEKCTGIIVGTDADVEGNGIFYLLKEKLGWGEIPTLRFFANDLTDASIKNSLLNMTDFYREARDVHMTECFILRSRFDWEVGMNMTIGAKVSSGHLLKIGRVKAPTLKLIYDNCKAIDDFVPSKSWTIDCDYENGMKGSLVDETGKPKSFTDNKEAQTIAKKIPRMGTVSNIDRKRKQTNAPKLYKLSDLQTEAGSLKNSSGKKFTPKETLDIAQSLYEKKLLSYPRTDGRYVSREKAKDFPKILEGIGKISDYSGLTAVDPKYPLKSSLYVNDREVAKASHDALIPTTLSAVGVSLTEDEKKIYDLVVRRFLSIFYPPLIEAKTTVFTDAGSYRFITTGSEVIDEGWTKVINKKKEDKRLPHLHKGMNLPIKKVYAKAHVTSPPKRLTEATLIRAMENISSVFDDAEYKNIMKEESGIGTPASRGAIISELKAGKYFTTRSNAIYISDLGKEYIEKLHGCDIINPALTAEMELLLKHIREGSEDYNRVKNILKERVIVMTEQTKNLSNNMLNIDIACPHCGNPMKEDGRRIYCENKDCNLTVWKNIAQKDIPKEELFRLLTTSKTDVIKGFTSKAGKKFDAALELDVDGVSFYFPSNESQFKCPNCGDTLQKFSWGYRCPNRDFSIGTIAGVKLTDIQIGNLLSKGTTGMIDDFVSRKGTKFSAEIILNGGKTEFKFPERGTGSSTGETAQETDLKCPVCHSPLVKFSWGYGCPNRDFSVGTIAGIRLSDEQIRTLINTGYTPEIEGFRSAKGKNFSAKLRLNEQGKIEFCWD